MTDIPDHGMDNAADVVRLTIAEFVEPVEVKVAELREKVIEFVQLLAGPDADPDQVLASPPSAIRRDGKSVIKIQDKEIILEGDQLETALTWALRNIGFGDIEDHLSVSDGDAEAASIYIY